MKILYLITGLGGGGAERIVANLADEMHQCGHSVKIAFLKGTIVVSPKSKDIEVIYLGLEALTDINRAFTKYKQLLKDFVPDVVHAHMVHANIFARVCQIFFSVKKLICSAHSNNEGGKIRMLAYRLTHNLSELTTNVSTNAAKSFIKQKAVPVDGVLTVYNGIDLNNFKENDNYDLKENLGLSVDTKIFIAVGRFHDAKDYPNLIQAFHHFKKKYSTFDLASKLIIVGDGELESDIRKIIDLLELSQDVILLGRRDDISNLLSASDFFVLSSKYEGLPTVVIEAMACKTFVIATDCGGSAEIMGDTGILVPPENSKALAQALKEAVNKSPLEIKENNLRARQRVEELFSLEKSVENWLKIYRNE